jgi:hypothetical protein
MLTSSVLVVVMMQHHAARILARTGYSGPPVVVLGDFDPLPVRTRTIADPWRGTPDVFDECYGRIFRCVKEIVRLVTQ